MSAPGDKIWYTDVRVLPARWREFFPTAEQTPEERVNALVRLVIYATLAVFVYNREVRTLVLGAGVVAVVSVAFGHRRTETYPVSQPPLVAKDSDKACTPPSRDNPFANVLLNELGKPRGPACAYDVVKTDVKKHFNTGLFQNATDVYETENSQRQFYSMPVTTAIPDTAAFANFLYGDMKNCKTNPAHCALHQM